jgi:hypothetical protein
MRVQRRWSPVFLWPKQHLDHADVDLLLQQVRGKAECRSVCMATRFSMPRGVRRGKWTARLSCRVDIRGNIGSSPGNSQPLGNMLAPAAWADPPPRAQPLAATPASSIAYRSLRPLPCSTRSVMRSLSMSATPSVATNFAGAQAGPVRHRQCGLVLGARGCGDQGAQPPGRSTLTGKRTRLVHRLHSWPATRTSQRRRRRRSFRPAQRGS